MCDIHRNKYGLSTETLVTVDSAFPYSPEVEISEKFLMSAFADAPDILTLLADSKFIEFAKNVVDLEPGYILVRLAIELDISSEMANLMREVDTDLIKRCLLIEKFSVFQQNSPYQKEIVTFVTASKYKFEKKSEVLLTLYSNDSRFDVDRAILHKVKDLADAVVRLKKGLPV